MTQQAVIDRFEDGWAVLLIGDGGRRLSVPRGALPPEAAEGRWLQVELDGDRLLSATIDEAATTSARQRILEKLERLRRGEHLE